VGTHGCDLQDPGPGSDSRSVLVSSDVAAAQATEITDITSNHNGLVTLGTKRKTLDSTGSARGQVEAGAGTAASPGSKRVSGVLTSQGSETESEGGLAAHPAPERLVKASPSSQPVLVLGKRLTALPSHLKEDSYGSAHSYTSEDANRSETTNIEYSSDDLRPLPEAFSQPSEQSRCVSITPMFSPNSQVSNSPALQPTAFRLTDREISNTSANTRISSTTTDSSGKDRALISCSQPTDPPRTPPPTHGDVCCYSQDSTADGADAGLSHPPSVSVTRSLSQDQSIPLPTMESVPSSTSAVSDTCALNLGHPHHHHHHHPGSHYHVPLKPPATPKPVTPRPTVLSPMPASARKTFSTNPSETNGKSETKRNIMATPQRVPTSSVAALTNAAAVAAAVTRAHSSVMSPSRLFPSLLPAMASLTEPKSPTNVLVPNEETSLQAAASSAKTVAQNILAHVRSQPTSPARLPQSPAKPANPQRGLSQGKSVSSSSPSSNSYRTGSGGAAVGSQQKDSKDANTQE